MSDKAVLMGKRLSWADLCQEILHKPIKSVHTKSIASLWSGYGSIKEVSAVTADGQHHKLIAKQVDPPPQSGVSHERKLKSYAAEAAFYGNYCQRVLESGGAAVVCQPLLVDVSPPSHFLFVLSDLREQYPHVKYTLFEEDAHAALDWLAAFHALWWEEVPGQDDPVSHSQPFSITASSSLSSQAGPQLPAALWDQGTYWHLDTRQQELHSISGRWKDLKAVASKVDSVLKGHCADGRKSSRHRTLVHGDFKGENLLWNDSDCCCAYDFQYCGEGLGVRDVAYMFASSVDIDVMLTDGAEQQLLQHYHAALLKQLRKQGKEAAANSYSFQVMTAQYELCLVDYVRFMAGWGMWGNAEWAADRTREVLLQLDAVISTARTGW